MRAIAVLTALLLIDKLMVTDFADILGRILAKMMVLLAAVRDLGVSYIP